MPITALPDPPAAGNGPLPAEPAEVGCKETGQQAQRVPRKAAQQAAQVWHRLEDRGSDEEAEPLSDELRAPCHITQPAACVPASSEEGAAAEKEQVVWARVKGYPFWPVSDASTQAHYGPNAPALAGSHLPAHV